MAKSDQDKLNLLIQTTKTGSPRYANTFNFTHQSDGNTLLRFYYIPPSGSEYIESTACLCVPTPLALDLAQKMIQSGTKVEESDETYTLKKVN